jgi:hypothetical protein
MNSGRSLFNNNCIRPVMILVLGLSLAGTRSRAELGNPQSAICLHL